MKVGDQARHLRRCGGKITGDHEGGQDGNSVAIITGNLNEIGDANCYTVFLEQVTTISLATCHRECALFEHAGDWNSFGGKISAIRSCLHPRTKYHGRDKIASPIPVKVSLKIGNNALVMVNNQESLGTCLWN